MEKNWLYPPEGEEVAFELMEKATRMVVNKEKEYPSQQITGIGATAKAVYANRIFPFRYKGLFRGKRGKILGGAISHTGILLLYEDHTKQYTWNQITSCKVTATYINNQANPNQSGYVYDIYLGFGEEEGFNFNAGAINFFEFGGRMGLKMTYQESKDQEKAGELFALYYNRVRSEKLGISMSNKDKKVLLHHPINQEFTQEVLKRFHSPEGVYFKKKMSFKSLEINPQKITFYKRNKKKIEGSIDWNTIKDVKVALGAFYALWLISYKDGVEYEYEFIWPNSWKLDPSIIENKHQEKIDQQLILPLCWLELL